MQKPNKPFVLGKRNKPESEVGKLNPTTLSDPALMGIGAAIAGGAIASLAPAATIATVIGAGAAFGATAFTGASIGEAIGETIIEMAETKSDTIVLEGDNGAKAEIRIKTNF